MNLLIGLLWTIVAPLVVHLAFRQMRLTILTIFSAFYLIGKDLQSFLSLPWYIRWYMADIGFVSFIGITAFAISFFIDGNYAKQLILKVFLIAGYIVAVIAEMITILYPGVTIHTGDWFDIIAYTLGLIISLIIIKGIDFSNQTT